MDLQMVLTNIQVWLVDSIQILLPVSLTTVYSVVPSSLLSYTINKLLASMPSSLSPTLIQADSSTANSHRVFVTHESTPGSPTMSSVVSSHLTGIVSVVDSASTVYGFLRHSFLKTNCCYSSITLRPMCQNTKRGPYAHATPPKSLLRIITALRPWTVQPIAIKQQDEHSATQPNDHGQQPLRHFCPRWHLERLGYYRAPVSTADRKPEEHLKYQERFTGLRKLAETSIHSIIATH